MKKFILKHPTFVTSLFLSYLILTAVIYEYKLLQPFNLHPIDYLDLSNVLSLALRQPVNVFIMFSNLAFIYFIPIVISYFSKKEYNQFKLDLIRIFLIVIYIIQQYNAISFDSSTRSKKILNLTEKSMLESNLNYLRIVDITLKDKENTVLKKYVVLSKLNNTLLLYNVSEQSTLVLDNANIKFIKEIKR